jgi:hypothetical protein
MSAQTPSTVMHRKSSEIGGGILRDGGPAFGVAVCWNGDPAAGE